MLALLLMVPLLPVQAIAISLIDSYGTGNRDTFIGMTDTHPSAGEISAVGQSFTTPPYLLNLTSVKFHLSDNSGAPDGTVTAAIYAHTGTYGTSSVPTGLALATSNAIAATTITAGYVLYEFTFTGGILLNRSTPYCFAVYRDNSNEQVNVGTDSSAPSHSGNTFQYNAGAWGAIARDTIFYIYGKPVYGAGEYLFYFDNAVYENNTDAGSVTVTAVMSSGAEDFIVDGSDWWSNAEMPTYFTWEVSAGIYRRIYVLAEENFTITLPEDTFTSYGFTLKDFTGEASSGDMYFETLRVVGGVERVIERMPVEQTINLITTTMVTNRNYVIQLTVGSTVYRYTFFSSSVDTTPTIVLNTISFDRTIQLSSKYVFADADRPTTTSLRVNYTNSRLDTNSVQVRIREMDGTLVNSTNFVVDTFTYTFSPVDNETSYYFDLIINTDTFTYLTWKKTLPWLPIFNSVPDPFTSLGTIGDLDVSRLFGFGVIFSVALLFSAIDRTIACFSIAITSALMSYWGFFPLATPILAVIVGLSVLIGLGLRGS